MATFRPTRPAGAPAYYLGRSATRWLDAVEHHRTRSTTPRRSTPEGLARAA